MDFNFKIYTQLVQSLQDAGFFFQTFAEYITQETTKIPALQTRKHAPTHPRKIVLRHDVEARYENALQMARIQHKMGIKGSYYFRFLPKSYSTEIIKEIADLGHEIGYHYDDLSACKGNREEALMRFQQHLEKLRKIAPVQTMTMEGAPLSPYDNRDLWKLEIEGQSNNSEVHQSPTTDNLCPERSRRGQSPTSKPQPPTPNSIESNSSDLRFLSEVEGPPFRPYHAYGILAEPYFDIDFNKLYYITDTGRRWDGHLYNVRDKATKENPITNPEFLKLRFHSTKDIIHALENGAFPKQVMLNFHPQRWNDAFLPWMKELFWQNAKNQGKRVLVLLRK